jgi:hypothetical protein
MTPTPTVTATPATHPKGDVDCSHAVTATDSLKILRAVAGLSVGQTEPCDDIDTGFPIQGDMNCAGDVTSVDALKILRHIAELPNQMPAGCAPIGP